MKSHAKDKAQVVPRSTLEFQGDLPCHASDTSNKAFSKPLSERSRSRDELIKSLPEPARPRIVLGRAGRAQSRSWPGG